ncbi:unnamed protein product, partial [Ilex paraguariensis]
VTPDTLLNELGTRCGRCQGGQYDKTDGAPRWARRQAPMRTGHFATLGALSAGVGDIGR